MTAQNYRRRYTEEEKQFIWVSVGALAPRKIANSLGRTVMGVMAQATRMGLSGELTAKSMGGMSSTDVITMLGVPQKTLMRLVHGGLLAATKHQTGRRNHTKRYVYTFDPYEVERFIRERGGLMVMHPVDPWQEIYEEARASLLRRYISQRDLVDVLGVGKNVFRESHWRKLAFPQPAIRVRDNYYDRAAVLAWVKEHRPYFLTKRVLRELSL